MKSIQRLITLLLLSSIVVALSVAVIAGYQQSQINTQALYDAELHSIGQSLLMVDISQQTTQPVTDMAIQIWHDDVLIFRSANTPEGRMSQKLGYSDANFKDDRWRILGLAQASKTIFVAYSISQKEVYTDKIITSAILPLVLALPVLALLIVSSVRLGLSPLSYLTQTLATRKLSQLDPIKMSSSFAELNPVVSTINQLLTKVQDGLTREKSFNGNVAHELRTPLSTLAMTLHNAISDLENQTQSPTQAQHLQRLHKGLNEVKRLTNVVNQLLLLTQTQPQQHQIRWTQVKLVPLLQDVIGDLYPQFINRSQAIELVCEIPLGSTIQSEPELIATVLINVLQNANKYADEGSTIMVYVRLCESEPEFVELVIENSGEAVSDEVLANLTKRFYRASTHLQFKGSGLGLALVQQIVEVHHGEIHFMNSPLLGGLRVSILLPYNA